MKSIVMPEAVAPLSLGVIADTHGVLSPAVAQLFAGVTHIVHAGDVGKRAVLRRLEKVAPVTAIAGNSDSGKLASSLAHVEHGEIGGVRFLVVHKPKSVKRLLPAAREEGVRLIVSGHLHEPGFRWEDGILYVNPGSATAPDEGDPQPTVAIVTLLAEGLAVSFLPVPRALVAPVRTKTKAQAARRSAAGTRGSRPAPRAAAPHPATQEAAEVGQAVTFAPC